MAAPEVQFTLDAINDNTTLAQTGPLETVDRDNSEDVDADLHTIKQNLQTANYVGVGTIDNDAQAIGTEYQHRVQGGVSLRLIGAHVKEHGHIDPDDTDGVAWYKLKNAVRRAILEEREFPQVPNRPNTTYTWLEETNPQDLSDRFGDFYAYECDILFRGFEELP